jgi:hypothetical protein
MQGPFGRGYVKAAGWRDKYGTGRSTSLCGGRLGRLKYRPAWATARESSDQFQGFAGRRCQPTEDAARRRAVRRCDTREAARRLIQTERAGGSRGRPAWARPVRVRALRRVRARVRDRRACARAAARARSRAGATPAPRRPQRQVQLPGAVSFACAQCAMARR